MSTIGYIKIGIDQNLVLYKITSLAHVKQAANESTKSGCLKQVATYYLIQVNIRTKLAFVNNAA